VEDEGILHLDSQHEFHEIDQQVKEFHMAESDERKNVGSDLSTEEDGMQGNRVLIPKCDNVKSPILDSDSDCDDQENLVLSPMKENSAAEIIWDEEDRVLDLNVLMSAEHSLHEEVIQTAHEQQDEIVAQASKKVPLDEFMVDDKNVCVRFQKTFEVASLMIDECDECNENLAVISYEMTYNIFRLPKIRSFRTPFQILLPVFHVLKCSLKRKSAHLLVQNFLRTKTILFLKYIMKENQNQKKKTSCFLSRREIFMFFRIQWQICCSQQ